MAPHADGDVWRAPVTPRLLERAQRALPHVWLTHVYGLTEGGGTVTHNPSWAPVEKHTSAGTPSFNVRIRIVDGDREVGHGQTGEIQVLAPTLCDGYWDDPAASTALFQDGWLRTGDLGHLDGDGYLHLTGRSKDLIISGGMNIFPAEVEEALERHPSVLHAAVFAVPDERWGEVVAAAVEVRAGHVSAESELIRHCRALLAGHKRPHHIFFVTELPRTASGKVRRAELADRLKSPAARHG